MKHEVFVQEKSSHRPARFASRVKEELSMMIPGNLNDPRLRDVLWVTITHVEITPDLKYAVVYFSLMDEEKKIKSVTAALNHASSFLRKELMLKLNTKITPHLTFKYDTSLSYADEMGKLFQQI